MESRLTLELSYGHQIKVGLVVYYSEHPELHHVVSRMRIHLQFKQRGSKVKSGAKSGRSMASTSAGETGTSGERPREYLLLPPPPPLYRHHSRTPRAKGEEEEQRELCSGED